MNLKFKRAFEEELIIKDIISKLGMNYINSEQVRCVFSQKSTSRALTRIWSTQKIFSDVFDVKPAYVIELIQPNFEKLNNRQKIRELIIKLMLIPKTFSGETINYLKVYEKDVNRLCDKVIL